jgi:hypothetical protein
MSMPSIWKICAPKPLMPGATLREFIAKAERFASCRSGRRWRSLRATAMCAKPMSGLTTIYVSPCAIRMGGANICLGTIFEPEPAGLESSLKGTTQLTDYVIDLDPAHRVLRLTAGKILTDAILVEMYTRMAQFASQGGPYAAIFDCSGVVDGTLSAPTVRSLAQKAPAVPAGTLRLVVAPKLVIYGLSRMFELNRDGMGGLFQVVRSLDEAYAMLGVDHDSFIQRLFP